MTDKKIKVIHLIDSLPLGGGAERALLFQLPALKALDVSSQVVVLRGFDGGIQQQISDRGISVRALRSDRLLSNIGEFRKLVKAEQPDLVHATLFESCVVSRLALVGTQVPLVNSVVNTSYDPIRIASGERSRLMLSAVQAADRATIPRVDVVHVLSDAVGTEVIKRLAVSPARVQVIPRGRPNVEPQWLASNRTQIRRREEVGEDQEVIVTVGRQDHQKNQVVLVKAFARIKATHPDARLWLIGRGGSDTSAIHDEIEESGVRDSVKVFGHREDVLELLAAADLFVFPSLYEGLGSACIEAMSVGLPLVISSAPALVEVAGGVASIADPRDVDEFAQSIVVSLEPSRRRMMSRASRRRFQQEFELDTVAGSYDRMYRAAVAFRRGRSGC